MMCYRRGPKWPAVTPFTDVFETVRDASEAARSPYVQRALFGLFRA